MLRNLNSTISEMALFCKFFADKNLIKECFKETGESKHRLKMQAGRK